MDIFAMDGCVYNPVGVQCIDWKEPENPCRDCGWNPNVAEKRFKEFKKKREEKITLYINVAFETGDKDAYSKVTHIYKCNFPVRTGDIVLAPTSFGNVRARVESIGLDYDKIDPLFRDDYRTITEKVKE